MRSGGVAGRTRRHARSRTARAARGRSAAGRRRALALDARAQRTVAAANAGDRRAHAGRARNRRCCGGLRARASRHRLALDACRDQAQSAAHVCHRTARDRSRAATSSPKANRSCMRGSRPPIPSCSLACARAWGAAGTPASRRCGSNPICTRPAASRSCANSRTACVTRGKARRVADRRVAARHVRFSRARCPLLAAHAGATAFRDRPSSNGTTARAGRFRSSSGARTTAAR